MSLARGMLSQSGMKTNTRGRAFPGLVIAAVLTLGVGGAAAAEPPADRVLEINRYTSDRGKMLGERYQGTLKSLNAKVYHCMPWIDVKTEGIGFYKPKHLDGDGRRLPARARQHRTTGGRRPRSGLGR